MDWVQQHVPTMMHLRHRVDDVLNCRQHLHTSAKLAKHNVTLHMSHLQQNVVLQANREPNAPLLNISRGRVMYMHSQQNRTH